MESVIQVNDGSKFKEGECFFCGERAVKYVGTVNTLDERHNGHVFKGFPVCNKHMTAINRLLDGTKDIELLVENYETLTTGDKFNLRALL